MLNFFADIANYEFLQRALITAVIVGILCGVLGSFIVLRGLALMGDAISHAVLPGVAISYMIGINYFFGAFLFGILTALGIGAISQHSRIKTDSSIGIVFSAFLALGVILIARAQSAVDLTQILFGNILAVRATDMWMTIIVGAIVLLVVTASYKELLVSTFDPTMAAAYGLPIRAIHYGLMVMLTLVTVAALQTVGVILVVALLVTPASAANLLTNRLSVMILLASLFGTIASVVGLYFSFEYNLPSGAVIVLVTAGIFAVVFLVAPTQGLIPRWVRSRRTDVLQADPASLLEGKGSL